MLPSVLRHFILSLSSQCLRKTKPRTQVYSHQVPYMQGQTRGKEDPGGTSRIRILDSGERPDEEEEEEEDICASTFLSLAMTFPSEQCSEGPLASPACPSRKICAAIKISMENWWSDTDKEQPAVLTPLCPAHTFLVPGSDTGLCPTVRAPRSLSTTYRDW